MAPQNHIFVPKHAQNDGYPLFPRDKAQFRCCFVAAQLYANNLFPMQMVPAPGCSSMNGIPCEVSANEIMVVMLAYG